MEWIQSEPIASSMPAAVLVGPGDLRIREIPVWDIATYSDPDMVLVKVAACGVCGSDFRYFMGENPWSQHTLGRFVPNPLNIVLGHEYSGTVVAVLNRKNEHLLGKRVAPVCSKVCGRCPDCSQGRSRLCEHTLHLGHGQGWGQQDYYPGAYAHYVPSWGSSCYEIPDHVSFNEASMMDILAVCAHVVDQGQIQPGRPVLVVGAGPAGNGIAQTSLLMGASGAILIDRSPFAIEIAQVQRVGKTILSASMSDEELRDHLRAMEPLGFGTVYDSVGSVSSLNVAINALGKAGTLVVLAMHGDEFPLNFYRLGGERRVVTSCNFEVGDYPKALAWLSAGRVSVKPWLTPTSLSELPSQFERITANPDEKGVFKLVVDPW